MANDKAEFWTTEQVAERLGLTVKEVYESRRRNEFPGSIGTNRGRRLLFRSDLILAGPQQPEPTSDPVEAILWTVQGIEVKLGQILQALLAQARPSDPATWLNNTIFTNETDSDGKDWEEGKEEEK